jgi:hypothetical protein
MIKLDAEQLIVAVLIFAAGFITAVLAHGL